MEVSVTMQAIVMGVLLMFICSGDNIRAGIGCADWPVRSRGCGSHEGSVVEGAVRGGGGCCEGRWRVL